jgi:hypothetical protein
VIEIPEAFAQSTVEREGEPGVAWLGELARSVEELLERWERGTGRSCTGASRSSSRCGSGPRVLLCQP